MEPHRFHPLHAVVGIVLVAVGVVTATFGLNRLAENGVAWGSAGVALVGLALLPWPRRPSGACSARSDNSSDAAPPGSH